MGTASIENLSEQLVELLRAPAGFRNPERAGLLLLHLAEPARTEEARGELVELVVARLEQLPPTERRSFAHGLAETREQLLQRPGVRTLVAMSVWEQIVARLPEEHEYLAREGEIT